MNKELKSALQWLSGKTSIDEVSVEELGQLANQHPYFSAAQLLLCKKMQQVAHPSLQQQLYKTALFFPDEAWLRYLLFSTSESIDVVDKNERDSVEEIEKSGAKTNVAINENGVSYKEEIVAKKREEATKSNVENSVENEAIKNERKQTKPADGTEDENTITLAAQTILSQFRSHFDVQSEPEEIPLEEDELNEQTEPLPIEESNQKIASILSGQAQEFHKPVTKNADVKINTEPLHAVDYFASQGILLDEKKEDTSLDKKVHKFTDWLRQMKRINPLPVDLGTDSADENFVANIAASSNQGKEIVTEPMAEVLLKQNKRDKAIELYEKLSLLYPLKNAYFAAKIQQIKR